MNSEWEWKIPIRKRNPGAGSDPGLVIGHALVDEDIYDQYAEFAWRMVRGYAMSTGSKRNPVGELRRHYFLHRLVLGLPLGDPRRTDHINRNRLDCRRANLRIVTQAQNNQNLTPRSGGTSRYRGVNFHPHSGLWHARATVNGVNHSLGYYEDEDDAGAVAASFRAQHMPYSTT